MEISKKLIQRLAKLAHLSFDEAETVLMQADLKKMLSFIQTLESLDTENVEPLLQVNELKNKLRPDKVVKLNTREAVLEEAPKTKDSHFAVPKVIDK